MVDLEAPPRAVDPARAALGAVATAHIGALVFSDSFRSLPAALVAYGAAWWVVRHGGER